MAEITIQAKSEGWDTSGNGYVDFSVWDPKAGMSLQMKKDTIAELDRSRYAYIDKQNAILLVQTILQMYNLPFTPNPVS
jgi:hypothetical protein